ncbi:hypothetical protein P389DRAFT_172098 [Cystobasidium minutum MCA 4210]|uniref:uncharacterized protein n=1 Tax=Cystobasidium minutum MCA 4210 TaxID=1397322 RepID=UPI0034CF94F2|eukprot:jgi/Rhomi1/172098/fgenesh1_kg.4_\
MTKYLQAPCVHTTIRGVILVLLSQALPSYCGDSNSNSNSSKGEPGLTTTQKAFFAVGVVVFIAVYGALLRYKRVRQRRRDEGDADKYTVTETLREMLGRKKKVSESDNSDDEVAGYKSKDTLV